MEIKIISKTLTISSMFESRAWVGVGETAVLENHLVIHLMLSKLQTPHHHKLTLAFFHPSILLLKFLYETQFE